MKTLIKNGTVITAGDGQEALDVLQKHADDIRCVVLDLVMAGMDGAQTLAGIRAHHAELPVLIATAYPAQQATDLLQDQTYHGLIHKPYSGAALARLLQSLLG